MLNSLTLRQQHFLHQRKNLYIPILGRIFSGEPDSDDNHRRAFTLEFFIISLPDFIRDSAERERCPHVKLKKSSEYKEIGYRNICRSSQKYLDMFWLCYEAKVHCLSRQASYALLVNGFNRQVISLVFPDYEAVSVSDFLYISEHILYFTLFVLR